MTEVWTKWQGQVINGVFPLRRFVRASSAKTHPRPSTPIVAETADYATRPASASRDCLVDSWIASLRSQ